MAKIKTRYKFAYLQWQVEENRWEAVIKPT